MNLDRQPAARHRADRIAAFRAELAELEREQALTLTADQRSRLEGHLATVLASLAQECGGSASAPAQRISWALRTVTLLGAVAFAAAIVLFLHRVWGLLPDAAHAAILLALPLLSLAATECAFRRGADRYYLALLGLSSGVGFVMGLDSLGSTLNLVPSVNALLAWAAFGILVGYAYGLRLMLAAGLVLLCAGSAALWVAAGGGYWPSFLTRSGLLLPVAAVVYALPWWVARRDPADFAFVYRMCGGALGLLALLLLSKMGDLCCGGLTVRTVEALYQFAGLALGAGLVFHGLRLGRSGLVNLGAAGFVVFLFVRLHAWWWNWMPKYLFCLVLGLIAFLLVFPFRRLRRGLLEQGTP